MASSRPADDPVAREATGSQRAGIRGEQIPASGAWRPGDPVGRRRFHDAGALDLEAGGRLPRVTISYETWGTLNEARDNAILVVHALTGDSHVHGPAGPGHPSPGWWSQIVGPGRALDTDRWFVVAPNALGACQGSTGPASPAPDGRPWAARFPRITIRDQVRAELGLLDELGIDSWASVVGASLGGHRALEWAAIGGERVRSVIAIATSAATSADHIAWAHPQLAAIRLDPNYRDGDYYDAPDGSGPHRGLAIARQIAHTTYRSAAELDSRFGRFPQHAEEPLAGGRFAVQSYLDHHGAKLALRFDANSYVRLTEAMLSHDLGRDRGGVEAALGSIGAQGLVVAVDSDRLFLPEQSEHIAAALPGSGPVRYLHSPYGHDGFLIEHDQLATHLGTFLDELVARHHIRL